MAFSDISLKKLFISALALTAGAPAAPAVSHNNQPRRLGPGHETDAFEKRAPFSVDVDYPETGVSKALRRYAYDHPMPTRKG